MFWKDAKIKRLMGAAFEALEEHDVERALELGQRLKKLRHSSAFEVLALAYEADDKLDDAVAVLEEGVRTVPSVWVLWQLLGNRYSDLKRYAEAATCYRSALACPVVDASAVHLNAAIALRRGGKFEEGLEEAQRVTSAALQPHAMLLRMRLLNGAQRFAECANSGEQALSSAVWGPDAQEQLAGVHAELSVALCALKSDRELVLQHAWKAIELDRCQATAASVVRSVSGRCSPTARRMTVLIMGSWPESVAGSAEDPGFFATYSVVAESAEEALGFITPFEPAATRASLVISKCTPGDLAADEPKGVTVVRAGYTFFRARRDGVR